MGKVKTVVPLEKRRRSSRVAEKTTRPPAEIKKKVAPKKAAKAKKAKLSENGNPKAEEPKTEATEVK